MTARINYANIAIVVLVLVSGTVLATMHSYEEKENIVASINGASEKAAGFVPHSAVMDAAPSLEYDSVSNTMNVANGALVFTFAMIAFGLVIVVGSMMLVRGCAMA
jgi:hypothetical protein